ncbi:unnamed protein product [Lepeophtheirus salmonis]|uniref:(salmon louse) hypothetical protein n=1 Tax=Lepeophtheirus salmonis TaxID=72036 RepID=A0A7R8HEG3_LEPSM|nr:unnamed protein product [Lepeophtheirus salmonis]CAF3028199.1 unnamed protein product [Lepeophtheirus salmonis]
MTELSSTKIIPDSGEMNSSDWQMNKINISDKVSFLYLNSILADVEFALSSCDAKTIIAHKFVLSVGSPVFYAMFNGGSIESGSQKKKIEISDVEPEVFETLLVYLYLDRVFIIRRECYSTPESNVISFMDKTRIYDCPEFWDKCWNVIKKDPKSSFESESFVEINLTSLKWANERLQTDKIIKQNDFDEEENMKVLGVMKRKVLGNAFNHICFQKMSTQEICEFVVPSGLLSAKEIKNVFLRINSCVDDSPTQTYSIYNIDQIVSGSSSYS